MTSPHASVASLSMPRRNFLKTSAELALGATLGGSRSLAAAERRRSVGANDHIRIAQIGCGNRGRTSHMMGIPKHLAATNFERVAVRDPWRIAREQANARAGIGSAATPDSLSPTEICSRWTASTPS